MLCVDPYTCTGYAGGLLTFVHGGVDKTRYLVLVCDEDVRRKEMGTPGQYGVGAEAAGQEGMGTTPPASGDE